MVNFGARGPPSEVSGINLGLVKSRLKAGSPSRMESGRLSRSSLRGFVADNGQQELSGGCFSGATSVGSSSSNVSVAGGSLQSSPRCRGKILCVSCKEETQIANSKLYSKGCSDARQCNQCNAISIAMVRHNGTNDQILKQFRKKTAEQQIEYMVAQKRAREQVVGHPSQTPYTFLDLLGAQKQLAKTADIDDGVTAFIPLRQYYLEENHGPDSHVAGRENQVPEYSFHWWLADKEVWRRMVRCSVTWRRSP